MSNKKITMLGVNGLAVTGEVTRSSDTHVTVDVRRDGVLLRYKFFRPGRRFLGVDVIEDPLVATSHPLSGGYGCLTPDWSAINDGWRTSDQPHIGCGGVVMWRPSSHLGTEQLKCERCNEMWCID